MIDIHPPQHGSMTRRDFFVHLFIVVLGILIAIGLEQSVEYLHHRHLAAEARSALIAERQENETANEANIFGIRRNEQDLEHDLAMLHALQAHEPLPPGPFIVHRVTAIYLDEEWKRAHQSGTINYVTGDLRPFSQYRYGMQEGFKDLSDRSQEDLLRGASVLRSSTDPLNNSFEANLAGSSYYRRLVEAHEALPQQEVDAYYATLAEPGNLTALSSAQIDSLARTLQIALSDDDRLLNYCFTIKRNLANNPVR